MYTRTTVALAALVLACAPGVQGQDIAQQVKQTRNGTVRIAFASKPGTCGDGRTFISAGGMDEDGQHTTFRQTRGGWNTTTGKGNWDYRDCFEGPVWVDLEVADGDVVTIETYVGAEPPRPAMTVSTRAAVAYLLTVAETSPRNTVAKHALMPALLADSVEPWDRLLHIAKNETVSREVRKSATFWLGQGAGVKATEGLKSLLSQADIEIKKSAVFALSQIRGEESVTALIDVVKTSKDREVKKSALFWLAQKNDPRVLALMEDILLRN